MANKRHAAQLREELGALIGAYPIWPPQREGSGLDYLDLVVLKPQHDSSKAFFPLNINLRDVLSTEEMESFDSNTKILPPLGFPKVLATRSENSLALSFAINSFLANTQASAVRINEQLVAAIFLQREVAKFLSGNVATKIEHAVWNNYIKLMCTTSLRHFVRKKFIIGVITKVVTAEVHARMLSDAGVDANLAVGVNNLGGNASGNAHNSKTLILQGCGIIGVHMSCFVVQCNGREMRSRISTPIPLTYGNKLHVERVKAYVRGGRCRANVLLMRRVSKYLFSGAQIRSEHDLSDEEGLREDYKLLLQTRGMAPAALAPARDESGQRSHVPELLNEFLGASGASLWNDNANGDGRNVVFVASDPKGLIEVMDHADLRWLPQRDLPDSLVVQEDE